VPLLLVRIPRVSFLHMLVIEFSLFLLLL
jgi:hypothetical protein